MTRKGEQTGGGSITRWVASWQESGLNLQGEKTDVFGREGGQWEHGYKKSGLGGHKVNEIE